MSKLLFLLILSIHAQTTVFYTPREIEVTPWPETTTTLANYDLFGEIGWGPVDFIISYKLSLFKFRVDYTDTEMFRVSIK